MYVLVANQFNFFKTQPIKQVNHMFVFYVDNSVKTFSFLILACDGNRLGD